jgi:ADP-ribose pyrophosphatase YjhB (NUDIX family)
MKFLLLKLWKHLPLWLQRILSRLLRPSFQVFAAGVIVNEDGKILLVRLTYQDAHPWGLPGGNLEYGESPEDAARREVLEETGLVVTVGRLLVAKKSGVPDQIGLFYACEIVDGTFVPNDEVSRCEYFDLNALPDVRSSDVAFLRQLVEMAESAKVNHMDDVYPANNLEDRKIQK